jgi:hypothetical protein
MASSISAKAAGNATARHGDRQTAGEGEGGRRSVFSAVDCDIGAGYYRDTCESCATSTVLLIAVMDFAPSANQQSARLEFAGATVVVWSALLSIVEEA